MLRFPTFRWLYVIGALAIGPELCWAQTAADKAGSHAYEFRSCRFSQSIALNVTARRRPRAIFRLDQLTPDFAATANRDHWLTVLKRMKDGEMPPKAQPRPDAKDMANVSDWIRDNVVKAEAAHRAEGRTAMSPAQP